MRQCNVCQVEKELDEFHKASRLPLGRNYTCKICARERSKRWNAENATRKSEYGKVHYSQNKAVYVEYGCRRYQENKNDPVFRGKRRASERRRYQENPAKYRAKNAAKRGDKAMPPWLTQDHLDQLGRIYSACENIVRRTGRPHHVDHIIPLNGENVCGLHVPWNLQILRADLNIRKSNKLEY
jgi:hypothetical protein